MKLFLASIAAVSLAFSPRAFAQNAATPTPIAATPNTTSSVIPNLPLRAPIAANIEGTVQLRRFGWTQSAQLKFSAPDSLFVHVQGDATHLAADEFYIARADTQTTYSADLKRVRQWRWSSAREPWRSQALADGGPANIWLWGWNPSQIAPFYNVSTTKTGDVTTIVLTAKPEKARQVRDVLRSGGRGERLFYAPFKQTIYDWPRRVVLKLNANNAPTSLEKRDARNRVLETTAFTWKSDGWPLSATTRDGNNHVKAQWKYDLKAATQPFSNDDFDLEKATRGASASQIVEDVEPLPMREYVTKNDADAVFNRGVVEATHLEDFGAAQFDWNATIKARPQAVAPLEAAFDNALDSRDWRRANALLTPLASLLQSDDIALLSRRVRLATLTRDWASVMRLLGEAEKSRPSDASWRLQRANLMLLGGDVAGAQRLLTEIISLPLQQTVGQSDAFGDRVQANAAQLLAQTLSAPNAREDAVSALQTLPKTTDAQKLARSLIALQLEQKPETSTFDNDATQAFWADALTANGKLDEAIAAWKIVAARASLDNSYGARRNLVSLYAQRGDVTNSHIEYSKVVALDLDEAASDRTRDLLFESWRKAGKSENLRRALQTRSSAVGANDDDARLWLAWQENYATSDAIGQSVRAFATRYPKSAWWQSRLGEQLVSEAAVLDKKDFNKERFTAQALTAVRRAVALDATQPYYAVQAALILTLRANDFRKAAVGDATSTIEATNAARQELEKLGQTRGDDPDISLAIAFAGQALSSNYPNVVELLQRGLQGGLPGRESLDGDRHATAFTSRQALAIALRRQRKFDLASREFQTLMAATRDPSEELGIAINYLLLLKAVDATKTTTSSTGNAASGQASKGAAQLLARLSSEAWPLEAADGVARTFANYMQQDDALWQKSGAVLRSAAQPEMQLGGAYFFFSLENNLSSMAKRKNNAAMQKYLDDLLPNARGWSDEMAEKIAVLADGSDNIVASRAASLLGGRALARGDFGEAIRRLQNAVALEPDSVEMRLALARAFATAGRTDEALQVRDVTVQIAPDTATLNRLAALSTRLGKTDDALQQSRLAWNLAASPDTSSGDAQRAGLLLARALVNKGRFADALPIYANLSNSSWDLVGRVAALSDAETQLRKASETASADSFKAQLAALKPSLSVSRQAQALLASLNN